MITLTFDDALLDTYEVAFPIMEKYEFKGVAFVPTGILTKIIETVRIDNEPYMSHAHVRELHNAGWEIGSHSVTHPRFDELSLERAEYELKASKDDLILRGFEPVSFAFPYGHGYYTDTQVSLALRHYRRVRTVTEKNPVSELLFGYPGLPETPPVGEEWSIFVLHRIMDPKQFENWLQKVETEIVTFREMI